MKFGVSSRRQKCAVLRPRDAGEPMIAEQLQRREPEPTAPARDRQPLSALEATKRADGRVRWPTRVGDARAVRQSAGPSLGP